MTSPIRPTDDEARQMAAELMQTARFAALATLSTDRTPTLSRVAFGLAPDGAPISLVSTLSAHTQALISRPACSLLVGEPGEKGDPLTHPRLTLNATATLLPNDTETHQNLAAHYLLSHAKSKLYIGFGDFHFLRFTITDAFLNGGFGKAFQLTSEDLGL